MYTLPQNFNPSPEFIEKITNCAKILHSSHLETWKDFDHEINQIGPNPEELTKWLRMLNIDASFLVVTAALATIYVMRELKQGELKQ